MHAYLEAYKNLDVEAARPLLTGAAREDLESSIPEFEAAMAEIGEKGAEVKQWTEWIVDIFPK